MLEIRRKKLDWSKKVSVDLQLNFEECLELEKMRYVCEMRVEGEW